MKQFDEALDLSYDNKTEEPSRVTMSRLFEPIAVGPTRLEHRVAMAPLTRYRWGDDWDATDMESVIKGEATYET